MKFAIQIHGSPYGSGSGDSAYQFIRAALNQGYEMVCVFFYHEAAYQALKHQPPDDEIKPAARWLELARQGGFVLDVCISAAQRRGVAAGNNPASTLPDTGFRLSGLGLWVDACLKADRVLIFRD